MANNDVEVSSSSNGSDVSTWRSVGPSIPPQDWNLSLFRRYIEKRNGQTDAEAQCVSKRMPDRLVKLNDMLRERWDGIVGHEISLVLLWLRRPFVV